VRRASTARLVLLAMALVPGSAVGQDRVAQLRSRFERESDPVHKAKQMPPLGEEQFKEIREKVRAGQIPDALPILDQYRGEAEACAKALDDSGINAEKHSDGFKQLEISLREALRRINEMLPTMTSDEQPPFLEARTELTDVDQHLVHELFPQRPR